MGSDLPGIRFGRDASPGGIPARLRDPRKPSAATLVGIALRLGRRGHDETDPRSVALDSSTSDPGDGVDASADR